jgi:hypothetical protein
VTALAFLLIALVLSAVGSLVLWLQHRKPTSLESSIDSFRREMKALSPESDLPPRRGRRNDPGRR